MSWHWGSDIKAGAGHYIHDGGAGLMHAVDCPDCGYGTLKLTDSGRVICIDCGKTYPVSESTIRLTNAS